MSQTTFQRNSVTGVQLEKEKPLAPIIEGFVLPLTEAQREMWLGTQMGPPASAAHNESCIVSLDGRFELEAMRRAIETVVNRHEALRATFSPQGEYQQFSPSASVEMPLLDLSRLEAMLRDAELHDLLTEGRQSFDLVNGPLFSFRIIRVEEDRHLLVFTVHHIACDGWSYDIVLRELGSLYSSNVKQESSLGRCSSVSMPAGNKSRNGALKELLLRSSG